MAAYPSWAYPLEVIHTYIHTYKHGASCCPRLGLHLKISVVMEFLLNGGKTEEVQPLISNQLIVSADHSTDTFVPASENTPVAYLLQGSPLDQVEGTVPW